MTALVVALVRYATPVVAAGSAEAPAAGSAPVAAPMRLSCASPTHRINPFVYGIAYYPPTDARDGYLWSLRPGARRWGGNHTSTYNWRLGNVWNTGLDWFFRNVAHPKQGFTWRDFLRENRTHGVGTALTIPTIGWVARDGSSESFPVAVYGPQQQTDPDRPSAGNGIDPKGRPVAPGPPSRTSVPMPPESAAAWVKAIRAIDARTGRRSVDLYLLDNEPMLWHQTHRDVHPDPVGYDELLQRSIAYARAIRRADPKGRIAGPCLWGWPAYFYSAKDATAGFFWRPDRRAHGDVPLLEWFLREMRRHEQRTGERLLDVVDVHFYPVDLPKDAVDPATRARRIRATRALWDPTYVDESWIDEPVMLLPRLAKIVADDYPGLGLEIGEYNFGGERDVSGGLAQAEVLGRLGEFPGLTAAFYWTYPPAGSPGAVAFQAFRNYDGHGAQFQPLALKTVTPPGASLFASRDPTGRRVVAVALNLDPRVPREAVVALDGCATPTGVRAFGFAGEGSGLRPVAANLAQDGARVLLPPYSITVLEVTTAAVAGEGRPAPVAPSSSPLTSTPPSTAGK